MGIISALRKTQAPDQPARQALRAHMAAISELQAKRAALSERDARARVDRDAGAASAERVAALSQACDQSQADARYGAGGADLPRLRERLAEAEREHAKIAGIARSAAIASGKYASDMAALSAQATELSKLTPKLLHGALLEEREARKARYEAARTEMVAALRYALEPSFAADALASQNGWPPLGSDAAFSALEIPDLFPADWNEHDVAAQIKHGQQLEAAQRDHREAWLKTQAAGAALANALLNGEARRP